MVKKYSVRNSIKINIVDAQDQNEIDRFRIQFFIFLLYEGMSPMRVVRWQSEKSEERERDKEAAEASGSVPNR